MASTTPNIGLTLPTGTEGWKRSVINGNFMILDTKIGAVGNTSLQSQINTLSSNLTIKSYEFTNIGFNAGDVGIRAVQQSKDLTSDINTYGTPISAIITSISDSGKCNFQAFLYGASLYLNGYSATTNSMSNNSVTVRVTFKKS